MELEQLKEGVADYDKSFEIINRANVRAGQWFETNAEVYDYFLGCLPPMDFAGCGFTMCEFYSGTLTNAFFKYDGRYFCMMINRVEPKDFWRAHKALALSLDRAETKEKYKAD